MDPRQARLPGGASLALDPARHPGEEAWEDTGSKELTHKMREVCGFSLPKPSLAPFQWLIFLNPTFPPFVCYSKPSPGPNVIWD